MEFNEKLQQLRKQKGLTQEELAQMLYVSRTAISKWESGKGYPNIDSLKQLSNLFGISVDYLLSGDQLLTVAKEDSRQKEGYFCDMVFGMLDCSASLFFFLPLFGQKADGAVYEVSLLALNAVASYLRTAYFAAVSVIAVWGILTLALQNCNNQSWIKLKRKTSLALNVAGVLLFIISSQPYAAVLLFIFLLIKALIFVKKR